MPVILLKFLVSTYLVIFTSVFFFVELYKRGMLTNDINLN